jgi:hypothetical protein
MIPIRREFFQAGRAWYGARVLAELDLVDEIQFGYLDESDAREGQTYDAAMRWHRTSDGVVAALEILNGAWLAFIEFAPLFRELAEWHDKTLTPAAFAEMLTRHGFKDTTPAERSSGRRKVAER